MNRSIAPNYTQAENLAIQFPTEIELANGIQLFWMKDVKDDSVKLDIEWRAGSKYQSKKLVANFTNKLVLSGNENKDSSAIETEIDYYGGFLQRELDRDHAGVVLYGLRENISEVFRIVAEALLTVTFPEEQFEKERRVATMSFNIEAKKVKSLCQRRFNLAVFGEESAYGKSADESDFAAVKRQDLNDFYKEVYQEGTPIVFLVGNVEDAFIEQLKTWAQSFRPKTNNYTAQVSQQEKGRIDNIEVEDALQSAIRVGRLMFNKTHPDYFGFQILNTVLGGYFGSRLMANIREDKGYTYGIGSDLAVMEDAAYFIISTEVGVDVREATLQEIFFEIEHLQNELISDEELSKVKNYLLGDFLRQADGPIAMMENFKNIHFNELPRTYYSDFIQAIHNVTAVELQNLAIKYLQKGDLTIVTAG
ncbi:MAG: zinc protease [Crocinitomix sp.]|jgi:zinc protease